MITVETLAATFLAAVVCLGLWLSARAGDKALDRRVRRVAAVLAGGHGDDLAEDGTKDVRVSAFRTLRAKSQLREFLDKRFCMLDGRDALPKAGVVGLVAAVLVAVIAHLMQFGLLVVLLAPAAGAAGAWGFLSMWDSRVRAEFVKQFPEVADQIVRLARAGVPPVEAITEVAKEVPEPARHILRQISDELSSGLDPDTVLRDAADHVRVSEFTLFTSSLTLQRTTGGSIAVTLGNLAATVRARMEVEAKAQAGTAQTRITLWVLAVVPVVSLLSQFYTSPETVEVLFNTEQGAKLLRWGFGLIAAGLLSARIIAAKFLR